MLPELRWTKSSYSEAAGNACVEVATAQDGIAVRDSKHPATVFVTGRVSFSALIEGLRSGSLGSGR
ncbi:hypothetical protein SALBM217S_05420 [Streptomyces griseoloalbus]|uniref:DUF397 domain-containing protein n=1 Tax=Streptomyces pseudogriseolus TaxID=36817 RepID=A0ABQ2TGY0_STREZ|nr:DUF397 domain-containing protein [Streptomyces rubiginosus]GGS69792.1 hypothetical protein GCM10010285_56010 [Streptomyces rubiginosus]